MNKQRNLEEIEKFKEHHLKIITEMFIEYGSMNPIVTVLNYIESTNDYMSIGILVPGELMRSNEGKDIFAETVPNILKAIANKGCIPLCMSWSSEAWIRKASTKEKTKEDVLKEYDSLPKEEAIVTFFESADGCSIDCQLISRTGKTVNPDGDLVDQIELTRDELSDTSAEVEGRFANLFKTYLTNNGKDKDE